MKRLFICSSTNQLFLSVVLSVVVLTGCESDLLLKRPESESRYKSWPSSSFESPVAAGFYRANANDTLASIAQAYGRDVVALARWNQMLPTGPVYEGQVLRVAPPISEQRALVDKVTPRISGEMTGDASKFRWPASGSIVTPFVEGKSKGIEISGEVGEDVLAAGSGRVVYAGEKIKAYGLMIVIKHDSHWLTAYGGNRRLLVKEGDLVSTGQIIAEMGNSAEGRAVLRFEIRNDGKPVDPLQYLPKIQIE